MAFCGSRRQAKPPYSQFIFRLLPVPRSRTAWVSGQADCAGAAPFFALPPCTGNTACPSVIPLHTGHLFRPAARIPDWDKGRDLPVRYDRRF